MDFADLVPAGALMRALVRLPLAHFVVLGALLFAVKQLAGDGRAPGLGDDPIRLSVADVERLRSDWSADTGRAPGPAELDAAIQRYADDEILYREAVRLGLDRSDPVVRSRLAQNMRFVHGAGDQPEDELIREAFALGLQKHDTVVRRRLIEAIEERIAARVKLDQDQVRAYVAAHQDRYATPARVRFHQVFIDPARHADVAVVEAAIEPALGAPRLGDAFLLGDEIPWTAAPELARRFGGDFARAVLGARPGVWSGPITSTYGVHYVHVDALEPAAAPDFAAVARQAWYALLEERERAAVRDAVALLRRHYPLEVEGQALALAAP